MIQVDFEIVEQAFIEEKITLQQFIDVLIDNFGYIKTKQIIKKNLKLARKKERESK